MKKFQIIMLLIIGATFTTSCSKENVSTIVPTPTTPIVTPPTEVGKVTVTTGTPVVNSNTSITFSGDVTIVAPATVTNKYMIISWYNDTLQSAQSQTVEALTFTKTDAIPGTKYTVKAYATGSTGTISGNESFKETPGFHFGQTVDSTKVWDVWSNSDSATLISKLLAQNYAYGCQGTNIPGTSVDYGTGMTNSIKINTICPASAANLCLSLGTGWYLGSKGDWLRFFQNKNKSHINIAVSAVWSSTQETPVFAWIIRTSDAATTATAKMLTTDPTYGVGPAVYGFKKIGK
jgi:hypothetical protein